MTDKLKKAQLDPANFESACNFAGLFTYCNY